MYVNRSASKEHGRPTCLQVSLSVCHHSGESRGHGEIGDRPFQPVSLDAQVERSLDLARVEVG